MPNRVKNIAKHDVSFEEASGIFGDPLSLTIADPKHSVPGEECYITLGSARSGRLVVVVHSGQGDTIRIVSAAGNPSRADRL